jgi:hypothetical protein
VPSFLCIYLLALLNEGGRRSVLIVDTPAMKVWVSFGSHWGASFFYLSPHALRLDSLCVIHAPTCMLLVALVPMCFVLWWGSLMYQCLTELGLVQWRVVVVQFSTFWNGLCPHHCPACSAIYLTSPSFNPPQTFLLTQLPWNFGFLWWTVKGGNI